MNFELALSTREINDDTGTKQYNNKRESPFGNKRHMFETITIGTITTGSHEAIFRIPYVVTLKAAYLTYYIYFSYIFYRLYNSQ